MSDCCFQYVKVDSGVTSVVSNVDNVLIVDVILTTVPVRVVYLDINTLLKTSPVLKVKPFYINNLEIFSFALEGTGTIHGLFSQLKERIWTEVKVFFFIFHF